MKKSLSTLLLLSAFGFSEAQQGIYALTGKAVNQIEFQDFRQIDTQSGLTKKVILSKTDNASVYSNQQNKLISEDKSSLANSQASQIATLAVDSQNNIVYMPLFSSNIYVMNPVSKDIRLVENNLVTPKSCDLGSQFSRMATGQDGYVYTLSNDGTHFLKITSTNGKYSVKDLGIVRDHSANGENALTKVHTGYGGDMIGDINGNFYIFSAFGSVFKLDTKEMNAKFIGKIKGLPVDYTVNGAAVNSADEILLASAKGGKMHKLDLNTLEAEIVNNSYSSNTYDLASSYLIGGKGVSTSIVKNEIYPTNVTERFINVRINSTQKGSAVVKIYNSGGALILSKAINHISNSDQKIELGKMPAGIYLVNVDAQNGKSILSQKIIVN